MTADILHDFPIAVPPARVYEAITTPAGLDQWWTARSFGAPVPGSEYQLWFGPEYDWRAVVSIARPNEAFELRLTKAMVDWLGTRVGFVLSPGGAGTQLHFYHAGWNAVTEHFRISSFCWAMYLRLLRRYLEYGERVPYDERLVV
ncbi:MAG TPA: SRPBCC domain-containing protein [Gemmatimonadales bacterium]|nr:SRPBCC domain-containing protein [Gemmatimonadales bacterium]